MHRILMEDDDDDDDDDDSGSEALCTVVLLDIQKIYPIFLQLEKQIFECFSMSENDDSKWLLTFQAHTHTHTHTHTRHTHFTFESHS